MNKSEIMVYINDIAKRLKDPKVYGGASLIVGAGFSRNAESIGYIKEPPNWKQLADCMYQELYPKSEDNKEKWENERLIKTSGKNVLRLAEEYIAFFDRDRLNESPNPPAMLGRIG